MSEADLRDRDLSGFKNLAGLESRSGLLSAAAFDPVPFPVLPLFEELGPAQRFFGFMTGITVRVMFEVAVISVVAAQMADGLPESLQMFEH
jgi:hypothetical protein